MSKNEKRIPLAEAKEIAQYFHDFFMDSETYQFSIGGSIARECPTIGDVDIAVGADDWEEMVKCFEEEQLVHNVFDSLNYTKAGKLKNLYYKGIKVEFYVAKKGQFGAMQLFVNGSGDFNIRMRALAKKRGYKLSQYGLFEEGSETPIPDPMDDEILPEVESEGWIFRKLNIDYVKLGDRK